MPCESQAPFPTQRWTFALRSLPAPVGVVLHAFGAGSSAVPYSQSGPGSVVSPVLMTSLSPDCGFELFTAPNPQPYWSSREQSPPRSGTRKVGTVNPGWSQHWLRMQPAAGCPGVEPQPGMPAHEAAELPHAMHAP